MEADDSFRATHRVTDKPIPLNNLGPGQEYTSSITADLLNDTTYRISATLTGNSWDEQSQNDEIIGYITPFNLYDPMVEGLEYFNPGGLYAEGVFDIEVATNNWGNTPVDFDVKATVYSATPSDIYCGTPSALCEENFEGGAAGYRYEESQNPQGAIYGEASCQDKIFNTGYAYWFGHPCDTGSNGYGDLWANETLTIPDVDLTSMSGDFVSLNFEYYADTFYGIDSDGTTIVDVNDYAAMTLDILRDGATYSSVVMGQWNDYNEDGTCQEDENGDNIVNASEPIDFSEISYIGDDASTDGTAGNYNVFFNTNDLVQTTSIDLTHLYMLNTTDANTGNWAYECTSLAGSTIDINFEFQSDDDGRNGINDGFKGVAFNNISLQEFTFVEDNSYTISRTNVDAEQSSSDIVGNHEFYSGVYKIDVETIFDNSTVGKSWFNDDELSVSNNRETVIFNVESVDITLYAPNKLICLNDQTLECVMPIDSALAHNWEFKAINGVLAGDYIFNMNIYDMTSSNTAHSTTAGPAVSLNSNELHDVTFTPWNGWVDGHEYNISFDAELSNGNPSGNVRYFHATFADQINVAILSDTSTRTSTIKEDLNILGMSYTQFEINDWDTYFLSGWFTHYDKIVLPWQTTLSAEDNGRGYFQKLSSGQRKNTLNNFMSAGGTIQAHLGPQSSQVYGTENDLNLRLPLDLTINSRTSDDSPPIEFGDTKFADPYHPLMENVALSSFQGFDGSGTVATAVLDTSKQSVTAIPAVCGGDSESKKEGTLQRIIRQDGTLADQKNTILGVCSYQSGGMIISTIDVATHSERADSSTLPLLGNMLNYQVTPYPTGFGVLGNGLDLAINGVVPDNNASTGGYADIYIKSNAELTFSYTTETTESLETDWILDGPSSWSGSTMATGTDHITDTSPVATFCKIDLASATGCAQGVEWDITLILHDAAGHSRMISVTVQTNDVFADSFQPIADAQIDMREGYADQVEHIGTNTIQGEDWDVHRITLDDTGAVTIYFDASNSSDEDSLDGNGIERYEWRVLFDAEWDDDSFDITGHSFVQTSASNGMFAYTFKNQTEPDDVSTAATTQIRFELIVFDGAGKFSLEHKMYFEVVSPTYGDEIPDFDYSLLIGGQDCVKASEDNTPCQAQTDEITITGTILAGNEGAATGDVTVEIAFGRFLLDVGTSTEKFQNDTLGDYSIQDKLKDGDTFSLDLKLDRKYLNEALNLTIYIKVSEGSDYINAVYKQIDIILPACKGVEPPLEALAGGFWILDVDGKCQWSGDWTYVDGEWKEPQSSEEVDGTESALSGFILPGLIGIVLVVVVLLTLLFIRKGSEDDTKGYEVGETGFGGVIDQTEQYVQQLIAQGYPEETARAYAQQYASQAAAAAPVAATPVAAAPVAAASVMDDAVYQQYYQQFASQGYDAATAAAYAQQYALQYAQSQQ